MLRSNGRNAFLLACLSTMMPQAAAEAQIFARSLPEVASAVPPGGVNACGIQPCPPRVLTYGHYEEHWRRWPEDLQAKGAIAPGRGPVAPPSGQVPATDVPDPRDEGSLTPRRRQSEWSPAAGEPSATPPATPPARPGTSEPSRPTPSVPNVPSTPAEESGLGVPDDLFSPSGDATPPGFPMEDDSPALPPLEEEATPDDGGGIDDIFNLDDFGDSSPRLKRYQSHLRGHLRRAVPVVAQATGAQGTGAHSPTVRSLPSETVATRNSAASPSVPSSVQPSPSGTKPPRIASHRRPSPPVSPPTAEPPVQLAGHESAVVGQVAATGEPHRRRNPFRGRQARSSATVPAADVQAAAFTTEGDGGQNVRPANAQTPMTEPIQDAPREDSLPLQPIDGFDAATFETPADENPAFAAPAFAEDAWGTPPQAVENQFVERPAPDLSATSSSEPRATTSPARSLRAGNRSNPLRR